MELGFALHTFMLSGANKCILMSKTYLTDAMRFLETFAYEFLSSSIVDDLGLIKEFFGLRAELTRVCESTVYESCGSGGIVILLDFNGCS